MHIKNKTIFPTFSTSNRTSTVILSILGTKKVKIYKFKSIMMDAYNSTTSLQAVDAEKKLIEKEATNVRKMKSLRRNPLVYMQCHKDN